jgi:sigma-54 dependent transcriptional regulator, acetoin dehydrogenase operon transcriptional activator AcoR
MQQPLSPVDRARFALERGQRIPEAALPGSIVESWRRCLGFGLDPAGSPSAVVAPFPDVARRRNAYGALRSLALAEMQALHSQIAGSNFMIAFADAEGVVLDTLSDQVFVDSAAGRDIVPGSVWLESARGTNALGLALAKETPAAVYGREHFFASHGSLSCMAAPIVDPRGALVGLLDASCANEARQQHTHALVRMAAVQVENSLIFQDRRENFILAFHPRGEFLDTLSAGLIATSADGEVLSVNRAGAALLAGLPARSGADFAALFDRRFGQALTELLNGGIVRIRDRAGSSVFMACRRIGLNRARSIASRNPQGADLRQPTFVSSDPRIAASLAELGEALALRMPVHIFGETGVGKELMARHIHDLTSRRGEFVAVNCGAVPESLFVSELFGHERGAFTNARADGALGLARQADRGTLFLDEVSDIPLAAQTVLLRFLDSGEIRPVGSRSGLNVDVQIVSASNRSLADLVQARLFREDLMFRLNAYTIELPPLRTRTDFAEIARRLLADLAPHASITEAAIAALSRRLWPGNIRELRHALQRALLRRKREAIDEDCLDDSPSARGERACPSCCASLIDRRFCEEIEVAHRLAGGNVTATARKLGLSRTTVYKHLRR